MFMSRANDFVDDPEGAVAGMTSMITVLIGAPGAGKSTLATTLGDAGAVVLSLDAARAIVGAHEGDQDATAAAVDYTIRRARQALTEKRPVVIDATSTTAPERETWLRLAREHGTPAAAIVLDTPLPVCRARNDLRPPRRRVPDDVVERMWRSVHSLTDSDLADQGFAHVHRPQSEDHTMPENSARTIRIDPDQLAAIRAQLTPVFAAIRVATARAAAAEVADTSVDYRVGQRDGADLTAGRAMAVLDAIARQGVLLVND